MTSKENLAFQLDEMWSNLSQEKKTEYGEKFLEKSKIDDIVIANFPE